MEAEFRYPEHTKKNPPSLLPFLWEGRQKRPLGLSTRLAFRSVIERFCVKAKWIGWKTVEEDTWSLPPSCYVHIGLHGHKRICISHIHSPYSLKFHKSLNLTQKINGTCQCVPCLIWYLKVKVQMSNKKLLFLALFTLLPHSGKRNGGLTSPWSRWLLAHQTHQQLQLSSYLGSVFSKARFHRWNHIMCLVPINPILILCVLKHFRSYYSMIICFCLDKSI